MVDEATSELRQVRLSGRQIRVLAHPLRTRLLGRLRLHGPATATGLAEALGTNTGATSYHLRQLADVGLVAEEDRPGSGRQRWWRAVHEMSSWRRSHYDDDPDAAAAAEWLEDFQVRRFAELAQAWREAVPQESPQWRDAAGISDYFLTLSPEQLHDLVQELDAVVDRYRRLTAADPRPDGRQIFLYLAALPDPEAHRPADDGGPDGATVTDSPDPGEDTPDPGAR